MPGINLKFIANILFEQPLIRGYSKRGVKDKLRSKFWRDAVPSVLNHW